MLPRRRRFSCCTHGNSPLLFLHSLSSFSLLPFPLHLHFHSLRSASACKADSMVFFVAKRRWWAICYNNNNMLTVIIITYCNYYYYYNDVVVAVALAVVACRHNEYSKLIKQFDSFYDFVFCLLSCCLFRTNCCCCHCRAECVCVCVREYAGYHFHLVRARRKQMKAKQTKLLHAPCQVEATTTATHKLICLYTIHINSSIYVYISVYALHIVYRKRFPFPATLMGQPFGATLNLRSASRPASSALLLLLLCFRVRFSAQRGRQALIWEPLPPAPRFNCQHYLPRGDS